MKRRKFIFLLGGLLLAGLFIAARNAASWRPKPLAEDSLESLMLKQSPNVKRSRSGRWVVIKTPYSPVTLIDATQPKTRRDLGWCLPVFSPDGRLLARVTPNSMADSPAPKPPVFTEVSVEELRTGRVRQFQRVASFAKNNERSEIRDAAFSLDGTVFRLVDIHAIITWDVASGRLTSTVKREFDPSFQLRFYKGADKIWGLSGNQSFIFDARTGKQQRVNHNKWGWGEQLPNKSFYLTGDPHSDIFEIHRVADGKKGFRWPESICAFSPDGRWMVVGLSQYSDTNSVQLMEVGTWRVVAHKKLPAFSALMFDDADHLLVLDREDRVTRWRLR